MDRSARQALAERVARVAAARTGLDRSDLSVQHLADLTQELDDAGWYVDESGEPAQREMDFCKARAASALYLARSGDDEAIADSLYESIAALGVDTVHAMLTDAA